MFLHGLGLLPATYHRTVELLAQHARVIAPEWLLAEGRWSFRATCEAVDATLAAARVERATLVGHSFGGALALGVAACRPERIGTVVVVNALGASRGGSIARQALVRPPLPTPAAARDVFGSLTRRPRHLARAAWWAYGCDLAAEIAVVARSDRRRLVLWARGDALLAVGDGARLAERLRAEFVAVGDLDGPGRLDHDWAYRNPERLAGALLGLGVLDPTESRARWPVRPERRPRLA